MAISNRESIYLSSDSSSDDMKTEPFSDSEFLAVNYFDSAEKRREIELTAISAVKLLCGQNAFRDAHLRRAQEINLEMDNKIKLLESG